MSWGWGEAFGERKKKSLKHTGSSAWKANRTDMKPPLASQTAVKWNDTALFQVHRRYNQRTPGYCSKHQSTAWGTSEQLHWKSSFLFHFFLVSGEGGSRLCEAAPAAAVCTSSSHVRIHSPLSGKFFFFFFGVKSAISFILLDFFYIGSSRGLTRSGEKISWNRTSFVSAKGKQMNT